ncbi:MAG: hypothetical protein U9Q82_07675 [Chloroflexota bacterium]|nr:hypothetical protein [Chloroflexota bacterium]
MRRYFWLSLWLIGILFPMAWLGRLSARYQQVFDAIFTPGWVHVSMHLVLYAGLMILLATVLDRSITRQTLIRYLFGVLVVGFLQEGFQLFSAVQVFGWNTIFDLGIDLIGALIGFALAQARSVLMTK